MVTKIEKYSASWCQPCKVLDKTLESVTDVEIVKYDVEENEDLALEKGIRNVPVLIYYNEKGEEVARSTGAVPLSTIMEIINKY